MISFRFPNGQNTYSTWLGTGISFIFLTFWLVYAIVEFAVVYEYGDTRIMHYSTDSFFDDDYIFSSDDGFEVAFAMTYFNSDPEPIDDHDYGELVAMYHSWGLENK